MYSAMCSIILDRQTEYWWRIPINTSSIRQPLIKNIVIYIIVFGKSLLNSLLVIQNNCIKIASTVVHINLCLAIFAIFFQ